MTTIEMLPRSGFGFASARTIADESVLLHAERELLDAANANRCGEFAIGRYCARLALGHLGLAPKPILRDENGAPIWPQGILGSISHTRGLTVAIVVAEKLGKGVGVDAEHIRGRFPPDVFAAIGTAREKDLISRHPEPTRDRLRYAIFSAKESVFKCLYGAFKERWPLEAIDIRVDAGLNSFTTSPVEPRAGLAIRGHIGLSADHVVTVAWLPRLNRNDRYP